MFVHYIDINECSEGTAGCAHVCTDTIGSYICSCDQGYHLDSEGQTCNGKSKTKIYLAAVENRSNSFLIDIDECNEGTSGCAQTCTNTIGSYNCSCRTGFVLTNRHGCEGCTIISAYFNKLSIYHQVLEWIRRRREYLTPVYMPVL